MRIVYYREWLESKRKAAQILKRIEDYFAWVKLTETRKAPHNRIPRVDMLYGALA